MVRLILLLFWNGLFMVGIVLTYVFLTRRQLRIYQLVDHLAGIVRSALPLSTGLRTVADDLGGIAGARLERLARRLEDGKTLKEAFESVPEAAPPLVRRMAELGERSGNLSGFLEQARTEYRRLAELPGTSTYYFVYPLILTLLITGAIAGLHTFIAPKMMEVFDQIGVSHSYDGWWPFLQLMTHFSFLACFLLLLFIFTGGISSHFGSGIARRAQSVAEYVTYRVPGIGGILRDSSLAALSTTLALFLRAGATLEEALRAAEEGERNMAFQNVIGRLARGVAEGSRLTELVRKEKLLPGQFCWFVESGEASRSLSDAMEQAAVSYSTRVRFGAQMAMKSVVPLFIAINGGLVLGTCLLILLPLRDVVLEVGGW